jgi:hypothetical protein
MPNSDNTPWIIATYMSDLKASYDGDEESVVILSLTQSLMKISEHRTHRSTSTRYQTPPESLLTFSILRVHPNADIVDLLDQRLDETPLLVIINLHVRVSMLGYPPWQNCQGTSCS